MRRLSLIFINLQVHKENKLHLLVNLNNNKYKKKLKKGM